MLHVSIYELNTSSKNNDDKKYPIIMKIFPVLPFFKVQSEVYFTQI